MKRLFLDTNILCQEGFSSRNMAVLTRLVKAQHLTIYLSEISKREFISRYTFEINEKVKKVTDQIKKDIKLFSGKPRKRLEKRIEQIKSTYEDINKQAILDFDNWKKALHVEIIAFIPENINDVMNDYFSGGGVFSKIKNRNDIPDSMIHTSITQLLQSYGELTVVMNDNNFKAKVEENPKICAVKSLDDFFKLPDIKQKISKLDALENKSIAEIKIYFHESKFRKFLLGYLTSSKDLEEVCLEQEQIYNIDKLELFDCGFYGASLEYVILENIKNLDVSEVFMLSKNKYSINLNFDTIATMFFATGLMIEYSNKVDSNRSLEFLSGDEEVVEMSEKWHVKLFGNIEIEFKEKCDLDYLRQYCIPDNPCENYLALKLEIKKAELIDWCTKVSKKINNVLQ